MGALTEVEGGAQSQATVRLDVWLWAARFFRTRTLSKEAIEAGKVQIDGQKAKASRAVRVGLAIKVRQGSEDQDLIVLGVSERRGAAPEARLLYEETPASLERREQRRLQRELEPRFEPAERPSKKQRRLIHRFKRDLGLIID